MMNMQVNQGAVEALIMASPEPLTPRKIAEVFEDVTPGMVGKTVAQLNEGYVTRGSSYRIREIAGGFQFYILPEFTGYIEELFTRRRKMRLTRASLETLAIVAYRQPVTKTEIEHIRGVASDGVLQNLLEKGMVAIKGRSSAVGKPLQYGTTDEFLKFFGLKNLKELPKMSEIEELIASTTDKNQTQLDLDDPLKALTASKLNVADGTFDPSRVTAEDDSDGGSEAARSLELSRPAEVEVDIDADADAEMDNETESENIDPEDADSEADDDKVVETNRLSSDDFEDTESEAADESGTEEEPSVRVDFVDSE